MNLSFLKDLKTTEIKSHPQDIGDESWKEIQVDVHRFKNIWPLRGEHTHKTFVTNSTTTIHRDEITFCQIKLLLIELFFSFLPFR